MWCCDFKWKKKHHYNTLFHLSSQFCIYLSSPLLHFKINFVLCYIFMLFTFGRLAISTKSFQLFHFSFICLAVGYLNGKINKNDGKWRNRCECNTKCLTKNIYKNFLKLKKSNEQQQQSRYMVIEYERLTKAHGIDPSTFFFFVFLLHFFYFNIVSMFYTWINTKIGGNALSYLRKDEAIDDHFI